MSGVLDRFLRYVRFDTQSDESSTTYPSTPGQRVLLDALARELLAMGAAAVLLKGGHLEGDTVSDLLLVRDAAPHWMRAPRIATANTHGTGCTLSSAIAAQLALGADLRQAVEMARAYVRGALEAGAPVRTGAGSGPLNHAYAPQPMHLVPLR
jgi:hydroxymethylpyrimidine/phosphomethylpyrimidine kinase